MANPCPDGFWLTWHYYDPYDGSPNASVVVEYRQRPEFYNKPTGYGTVEQTFTGNSLWGWAQGAVDSVSSGENYGNLKSWHDDYSWWAGNEGYFTIDPATRIRCFSPSTPIPNIFIVLNGTASPPPPPPPENMCGCDCNTIATIIESQFANQLANESKLFENLKDHIDQRVRELITIHQKQLEALDFEEALKFILARINESENNLWNGIKR
jgi:hypothetical protein